MLAELIKAIIIGIIASCPLGPVSLLVLQKTFCHGRMAGFAAGLGSAIIDTLYAVASLFAFMFVQDFVSRHECWIMIGGGIIVGLVGLAMYKRKPVERIENGDTSSARAIQYAIQAGGCALANPGALAFMFGLVALFRLNISDALSPTWLIVLFIFAGAILWWFSFAFAADKMRSKLNVKTLNRVNRIASYAVLAFGAVLVIRGIVLI